MTDIINEGYLLEVGTSILKPQVYNVELFYVYNGPSSKHINIPIFCFEPQLKNRLR